MKRNLYSMSLTGCAGFLMGSSILAPNAQAQSTLNTSTIAQALISSNTYYDPVKSRNMIEYGAGLDLAELVYQVDLGAPPVFLEGSEKQYFRPYFGQVREWDLTVEGNPNFENQNRLDRDPDPPIPSPGTIALAVTAAALLALRTGRGGKK